MDTIDPAVDLTEVTGVLDDPRGLGAPGQVEPSGLGAPGQAGPEGARSAAPGHGVPARDEAALLRDARAGDPDAFVALWRDHEPRLRALAFRVLRDSDLVADALQETAVRAYRALGKFRGESALGTWLFHITYTSCLDLIAKRERQLRLVQRTASDATLQEPDPAVLVAAEDQLSRALDTLSPEHRAVVFLCLQQDLDLSAAATVLGIPYGTVGSRLAHAREVLRAALSRKEGDA